MILVVGATGALGSLITFKLLAQKQPVRILARAGSHYQPLVDAGAQAVNADLKDRASLDALVRGIDVVITTASATQRDGADSIDTVDLHGTGNLIDAAEQAGVRQFIYVSAIGASPDSPNPLSRAKGINEVRLRASRMGYTILTANIFMEIWIGGVIGVPLQHGWPVTLIGTGEARHSFVSMNDVAAFAVAAVQHPEAINQTLPIGGPEAVSWRQIVSVVGQVIGMPLQIQFVPPGGQIPGLPQVFTDLMTYGDTFETIMPMQDIARTFGVQQTTLEDYARRTFGRN